MGADALQGNGITRKILYLIQDRHLTITTNPLRKVRKSRILLFVTAQLIGFGVTFAITQTLGSFPYVDRACNFGALAKRYIRRSCYRIPGSHTTDGTPSDDHRSATIFHY